MTMWLKFIFGLFLFLCVGWSEEPLPKLSPEMGQALRKLNLPGIKLTK